MNHKAILKYFGKRADDDGRMLMLRDGDDVLVSDGFVGVRVLTTDPLFLDSTRRRFPQLPQPDDAYALDAGRGLTSVERTSLLQLFTPFSVLERVALEPTGVEIRHDRLRIAVLIDADATLTYIQRRYLKLLGPPKQFTFYRSTDKTQRMVQAIGRDGVVYGLLMPIVFSDDDQPLARLLSRLRLQAVAS